MASNYELITADNVRRRGEEFDDIGRFLSEQFYSDQTHFIYELLQNAQDALKRRHQFGVNGSSPKSVTISLFSDRLEVRHFGHPFNEQDVRGITDILKGTKASDQNQIGRFGIGFKSVYAFTSTPEIHSGDEHFVIEHYIRPKAVSPRRLEKGETLIIMPFNHPNKSSIETYHRIKRRLSDLGLRTILFLDQIDQVVWEVDGTRQGAYLRENQTIQEGVQRVVLLGEEGAKTIEEKWLVFDRSFDIEEGQQTRVEVAYKLIYDDKKEQEVIVPSPKACLFAYFETEKETGLKFLIQGHYNTTPSRDNIKSDDSYNQILIKETAKLVAETLTLLKGMNLFTPDTLEIMPLQTFEFPPHSLFRPFFDEVKRALLKEPLWPSREGGYICADQAKLARGTDLCELLDNNRLNELFNFTKQYQWLSTDITRDRTPGLRLYLMAELNVEEIDPERFGRQITPEFLKLQSDDWIIKFYTFLNDQRALWRAKRTGEKEGGVLRNKPFIRLEDNTHCRPFDDNNLPVVYLPSEEETGFATVKAIIASDTGALQFLENLGLSEPDIIDDVIMNVLPKYSDPEPVIKDEEHKNDLRKIFHVIEEGVGSKKEILVKKLRVTKFVNAINALDRKKSYKSPVEIYFENEGLGQYFQGNNEIWFLDYIYSQHKQLLQQLGVTENVRMQYKQANLSGIVNLISDYARHQRGLERFDPEWKVDGLLFAVTHPNLERAKFIWNNILLPNAYLIRGIVENSSNRSFTPSTKVEKNSISGDLVIKNRWLPNKSGKFHLPGELSLDDLPEGFTKDEKLAKRLGMKEAPLVTIAKNEGVDETDLNLIIQLLKQDPDAVREFALDRLGTSNVTEEDAKFDYSLELENIFSNPGVNSGSSYDPENTSGPVPDPTRRREKVREDIELNVQQEPLITDRFRRVPSNLWEEKNTATKGFLKEQYNGQCQICHQTFIKRDGEPYFEGVYLVSRLHKRWIDRPGNVLCLCPTCSAKLLYGPVFAENILEQIMSFKTRREGGKTPAELIVSICGEETLINFTEKHILDLQEIIKASQELMVGLSDQDQ